MTKNNDGRKHWRLAGVTKRNRPSCEIFYACESNYLYWHMDLPDTDVEWMYPVEKVFVPGGKPEGRYMGGGVDFCSQSVSLAIVYLSVLELPGVWTRKRQDKNRPRIGPTFKLLQCSRFFCLWWEVGIKDFSVWISPCHGLETDNRPLQKKKKNQKNCCEYAL